MPVAGIGVAAVHSRVAITSIETRLRAGRESPPAAAPVVPVEARLREAAEGLAGVAEPP